MRLACVTALVTVLASAAPSATFVVTSSSDSGAGTLRQAILDANATPGRDAIRFTVTPIFLDTALAITDPVDIDGRLPDNSRVTMDGAGAGGNGFFFEPGSDGSTLRSVTMLRISLTPIRVASGVSDVHIFQNEVRSGSTFISGDRTIIDDDNFICCRVRLIGGNANVVDGNRTFSVSIQFGANHRVSRNTLRDISAQQTAGLIVENNVFGVSVCPTCTGINLRDTTSTPSIIRGNTVIGGDTGIGIFGGFAIVQDNLLRDSTTGIGVTGAAVTLTRNRISGGTIAIDLGFDGPTPNDPAPDADTGANNRQNFPVLTTARRSPGGLVVNGTLTSALLTPYAIEFFSSLASDPKARTFVGSVDVTTDATGNASFQGLFTSNVPLAGEVITATATNRAAAATLGNAPNETSELSAPVVVAEAPNDSDIPTASAWGLAALALGLAAAVLLRS